MESARHREFDGKDRTRLGEQDTCHHNCLTKAVVHPVCKVPRTNCVLEHFGRVSIDGW